VVLPDRLQAYAFRRRLALEGGAIGANVGTFGDLYLVILREADQSIPQLSEPVVHRVLQRVIQDLHKKGELPYYSPLIQMPGFLRMLREAIAELKLARIWPETFKEEVSGRDQGLLELASIYQSYQDTLGRLGWADGEGVNWLATEALEMDPHLACKWPLLVIDGFDSFNGAQRAAIQLLGERLEEVIVTLPGLPSTGRVALRRFDRALQRLIASIPSMQIETLTKDSHSIKSFKHLEESLFKSAAERFDPGNDLSMIEVTSPIEEAREALRWLKARIERDDVKISNCSLIVPDMDQYFPFLREAAFEYGIPLRTFHGEPLSSSPPIAALLDLLELPLRDFARRMTLEAVRSPYFDLSSYGLSPLDAYRLEVVSQHGQVIQGMDQWQETLYLLSRFDGFSEDYDGEARETELPRGSSASALLAGLEAFAERLLISGPKSMVEWVQWLEDLMDDFHFLEERETRRDEAAFLGLREILRSFVLSASLAGEERIEAQDFFIALREIFEATHFQEDKKWTAPAVLVLSPHGARGLRFDAVAVLGLAEGIFPQVEREDPLLPDILRNTLGLEPRLIREQGGLFYQAVTRADRFLLLTRPYLADDGEYWEPSPYWNAVRKLFKGAAIKIQREMPRPLAEAASSQELLFWAVRRQGLPSRYAEPFMDRWEYLRRSRDVLKARQQKIPQGPFEGEIYELADLLEDRYGSEFVWSPSRLESYGTCPQRFFVELALELEEKIPPEPGFDALQLGTMLHNILEEAYCQADDPTSTEDLLKVLEPIAKDAFAHAPDRLGFRPSALWDVEQEQLLLALKDTILGLADMSGDWKPFAFERVFGMEGESPLELEMEEQKIFLRGIIDRLDFDERGNLRVIDYKAGFGHLTPRDLVEGRRLQLPLYALAANLALKLGEPVEGFYWAILRAEPGRLWLQRFRHEHEGRVYSSLEGAVQIAIEHVTRIVRGIRKGEFPPIPPRGGCPSYCAAAAWCWRYRSSFW
jgi:ATP-dependent helicase/DNAse subunit B